MRIRADRDERRRAASAVAAGVRARAARLVPRGRLHGRELRRSTTRSRRPPASATPTTPRTRPSSSARRASTRRTPRPYAMPAPQDVTFHSRDPHIAGLTLRGWWIPGRTATGPSVILVHGLKSCRRDENVLMPAGMLRRARVRGAADRPARPRRLRRRGPAVRGRDRGVPRRAGRVGLARRAGRAEGPDRDPRHVVRGRDDGDRRRRGARRAGGMGGLVLRRHGRGHPRLPRSRGLSDDPRARRRARGAGSWRATT